jgi:hypothetical protein
MRERGDPRKLAADAGIDATQRQQYLRRSVCDTNREPDREQRAWVGEAADRRSETIGEQRS